MAKLTAKCVHDLYGTVDIAIECEGKFHLVRVTSKVHLVTE